MYPSEKDLVYGTFVKTYMDSFVKLNKDGVTRLICIRGRSKKLIPKAIKYIGFYLRSLYHLLFKKYDIVYVQTITTSIPPLLLASRIKTIPMVFNVHGADVITISKRTEILKRMAEPLLYKAKLVVAPSEYFKEVVLDSFPKLAPEKVFVSPSGGVDLTLFHPIEKYTHEVVLGFVSRIDYGKGWEDFLEVLYMLRRENYCVKGTMAGRGAEQEKMLTMINKKGLNECIEYVGPVAHEELPNLFSRFDVFIFPSRRSESLGLVGVEAMACGVPVIGSNIGGIPGYVEDGVNGYLFESGNVNDLFEKLLQFLSLSKKERKKMSSNARNSTLRYDTASSMKELYSKLESM